MLDCGSAIIGCLCKRREPVAGENQHTSEGFSHFNALSSRVRR